MSLDEVTPETVLRYDKLRKMADPKGGASENERRTASRLVADMESKYPSIKSASVRQERYQDLYEKVRRETGMPRSSDVELPPTGGGVIAMMRRAVQRGLGEDPVAWALKRMERQVEAFVREAAELGLDAMPNWEESYMSLLEQLEAHCVIDIDDGEDDEGRALLVFEVELPPALWERVCADPDGPRTFVQFMRKAEIESRGSDE